MYIFWVVVTSLWNITRLRVFWKTRSIFLGTGIRSLEESGIEQITLPQVKKKQHKTELCVISGQTLHRCNLHELSTTDPLQEKQLCACSVVLAYKVTEQIIQEFCDVSDWILHSGLFRKYCAVKVVWYVFALSICKKHSAKYLLKALKDV